MPRRPYTEAFAISALLAGMALVSTMAIPRVPRPQEIAVAGEGAVAPAASRPLSRQAA